MHMHNNTFSEENKGAVVHARDLLQKLIFATFFTLPQQESSNGLLATCLCQEYCFFFCGQLSLIKG
jgi:hypothetical protein